VNALKMNKLNENLGAEVVGLDVEQLLVDDAVANEVRTGLREHGVLVFPRLGLDEASQVAFCQRLGDVDFAGGGAPWARRENGITRVSLDPSKSGAAQYLKGTFEWHIDGTTLPPGVNPHAATVLTAIAVAEQGGQTEFASTYRAYVSLPPEERKRLGALRVLHSTRAILRRLVPDRGESANAQGAGDIDREHSLVWRHRSGRRSLVIGSTADHVVGMDQHEGCALLAGLLERSTADGAVYRHNWSVGDTVMWDNRGMLHRVEPYDDQSPREMIRTSLLGDEPIQ
jgi:alpha-ketoglutarate-dependent taurine dioxygenase